MNEHTSSDGKFPVSVNYPDLWVDHIRKEGEFEYRGLGHSSKKENTIVERNQSQPGYEIKEVGSAHDQVPCGEPHECLETCPVLTDLINALEKTHIGMDNDNIAPEPPVNFQDYQPTSRHEIVPWFPGDKDGYPSTSKHSVPCDVLKGLQFAERRDKPPPCGPGYGLLQKSQNFVQPAPDTVGHPLCILDYNSSRTCEDFTGLWPSSLQPENFQESHGMKESPVHYGHCSYPSKQQNSGTLVVADDFSSSSEWPSECLPEHGKSKRLRSSSESDLLAYGEEDVNPPALKKRKNDHLGKLHKSNSLSQLQDVPIYCPNCGHLFVECVCEPLVPETGTGSKVANTAGKTTELEKAPEAGKAPKVLGKPQRHSRNHPTSTHQMLGGMKRKRP